MNIEIRNCNNIDSSQISLKEGTLNIKYAINGTGKTTISKALYYKITQNTDGLEKMIPFKATRKNNLTYIKYHAK